MAIDNCKKCNRVFQSTHSPMCPECTQESSRVLSSAYHFIQNNPDLSLDEVARYCDVPYKDLEALFLEGKLGTAANLVTYHCQCCNRLMAPIQRRGRICMMCAAKIETEAIRVDDKKQNLIISEIKAAIKTEKATPQGPPQTHILPESVSTGSDEIPAKPKNYGFERFPKP